MNLVMGTMYLVFPAFWIGALSWAGIKVGGEVAGSLQKAQVRRNQQEKKGRGCVRRRRSCDDKGKIDDEITVGQKYLFIIQGASGYLSSDWLGSKVRFLRPVSS